MSKNKLIFCSALLCFVGLTTYALWNEITRNTAKLERSISGAILTAPGVGGGIVKTDNAHKVRAATFIFNDVGDIVCRYDKIHLFDVRLPDSDESYNESEIFEFGDKIQVIETPIGITGLGCCYDLRFPELFRQQHLDDVETIILPAAFTEQTGKVHWDTLVIARAIENLSYVITSCQDGYHISGRKTHGNTMIVNPCGQIVSKIESGNGFILSEINRKQLYSIREKFPVLNHMRLLKK